MLEIIPCLDTDEMAELRRRELQIPNNVAARLGRTAVEAAERGFYRLPDGRRVDWLHEVQAALRSRTSIPPDAALPPVDPRPVAATQVQVVNETTLAATRRLVAAGHAPLALNFANGVQPGGGFLRGALAQEEVLCRSSALHATLAGDPMYDAHRERPLPDSSDWAIHSPGVPVFRTDDGTELERPWLASFLTCAAPYAPGVGQPLAGDLLQARIHRVLAIARACRYRVLVLGAWGCGAFGNDPRRTARDFRQALEGAFDGAFSQVVLAITDWSPERRYLGPFRDVFTASGEP